MTGSKKAENVQAERRQELSDVKPGDNVPLPSSMLMVGVVGFFIIFFFTIYESIGLSFGFALMLFFLILIIASYISMAPKDVEREL